MSLQTQLNPAPEKKRRISVEEEPTGVRAAVYSVVGVYLQLANLGFLAVTVMLILKNVLSNGEFGVGKQAGAGVGG